MARFFRHLTRLLACLFLFWQASLPAQTPASFAKDSLSFTVYAPTESPAWARLHYLDGAKEPVKLLFHSNRRSAPIKILGAPKSMIFGVEHIDPVTRQKTYVPVTEAAWPKSALATLVVFTIPDGTKPQVQATAVDDGPKAFPLRSVRLFNATSVTLLGKVADFQGEVPSGISPGHPYLVQSADPSVVGVVPLAFAINDPKEGVRLLYKGNCDAWPLGRSLIFILPPAQGSTDLRLRVLVDSPPYSAEKL